MIKRTFLISIIAMFLIGCKMENKINLDELKKTDSSQWNILSSKKIFFGHQSVGFNIIYGVNDIMKEVPEIKLKIIESANKDDFKKPMFYHTRIGKNTQPITKCDDFKERIENGIGTNVDIAFFKFCYIDITRKTDVISMFQYYFNTIEILKQKYPNVKFVHFTVPLQSKALGIKSRIKRFLKIKINADEDNIKRNEYNMLLREKYGKENTVFDLAAFEAGNDGKNRQSYLNSNYTFDGGHLNETGRKIIAKEFLLFLLNCIKK